MKYVKAKKFADARIMISIDMDRHNRLLKDKMAATQTYQLSGQADSCSSGVADTGPRHNRSHLLGPATVKLELQGHEHLLPLFGQGT